MKIRGESDQGLIDGWAADPRRAAHRGIEYFQFFHVTFFLIFVKRRLYADDNFRQLQSGL